MVPRGARGNGDGVVVTDGCLFLKQRGEWVSVLGGWVSLFLFGVGFFLFVCLLFSFRKEIKDACGIC